jgi:hypothetical protein
MIFIEIHRFEMKAEIVEKIIYVHENVNERLSKINPYILIVASVTGTLLILHVRKLLKNSEQSIYKRFFNYLNQSKLKLILGFPHIAFHCYGNCRQFNERLKQICTKPKWNW